jgi:YVTN family beta-propeller protein
VTNIASNTVTVIDTTTNAITANVQVFFSGPGRIAITPDGAFAYVANSFSNHILVIDIAINGVIAIVPVMTPFGIAITPDGAFAYVTNRDSDTVSVIDTTTHIVTATIPVGDEPLAIAFPTKGDVDPLGSLTARVQMLVATRTLTENEGALLIGKLEQVKTKINNGQTAAACNQLSSFINQVSSFVNGRSLTEIQGQSLINAANAIKTSLGC